MLRSFARYWLAGLCISCGGGSLELAFVPEEGARSLVLATEREDELVLRAIDLSAGPVRFTLFDDLGGQDARLTAFSYTATLEELDLEPGRLDRAVPGEPRRALPMFFSRHEGVVEGEFSGWSKQQGSGDLDKFALRETTIAECLDRGGCFLNRGRRRCELPCPEPPAMAEPDIIRPVVLPVPPSFAPCAPGFTETTVRPGIQVCEPHENGIPECAGDELNLYGSTGCERLGPACPVGDDWASDLPNDRLILYARPGTPGDPDGSRAAPFPTLREALLAADLPGTIVAASAHTFDEDVAIPEGVILWGACVSGTRLRYTGEPEPSTVTVYGNEAGLRNVTIEGARGGVAVVGSALLENVVIDGAYSGVRLDGSARLEANGMIIRGSTDHAVLAGGGVTARLRRTLIEDASGFGLSAVGAGTSMIVSQSAIRGSPNPPVDTLHSGLFAADGASVELRASVIEDRVGIGMIIERAGTRGVIEDVVVRGIRRTLQGAHGYGSLLNDGADVRLNRVWFDGQETVALLIDNPGTTVTASVVAIIGGLGVIVDHSATATIASTAIDSTSGYGLVAARSSVHLQDVSVRDTGDFSPGFRFDQKARATVRRVRVENAAGSAIDVDDARLTGSDLSVVGRTVASPGFGRGLNVDHAGYVELERVSFERPRYGGVVLHGTSNAVLRDLYVADAREDGMERTSGFGVFVASGSSLYGQRVHILRSAFSGASAHDLGTKMTLEDLLLDETNPADNASGGGVEVTFGAEAVLNRVQLRSNRRAALVSSGPQATVDGTDVRITGTSPIVGCDMCDADAVRLEVGGTIVLRRFRLDDNQGAGVALIENQSISLEDGIIENNAIGVRSTSEQIAIETLATRVRYRNNESTFSLY